MEHDRYTCQEPGCPRGRGTGHALYRTSPKGELFAGRCAEHHTGEIDPLAAAIEKRNQENR